MNNWRLIDLPRINDVRGSLTFIEGTRHVPFPIARVYYVYDVPGGGSRGGHAHREVEEFLIAVTGSFDVILNDGQNRKTVSLRLAYQGLYIPRLIWRELNNFSTGSVCLVLASHPYEESDYIRDYQTFLAEAARRTEKAPP